MYILAMFPYTSGKLHLGHFKLYTAYNLFVRYMQTILKKEVFAPIGFDSLGIPAENAARDLKLSPEEWTINNINYMRSQLKSLYPNLSWASEFATSWEEYQSWISHNLIHLYEKGYVYWDYEFMNYDPVGNIFLANEQVVDGKAWRTGAKVVLKPHATWFINVRKIIDDLYNSTGSLDWPEYIKTQQLNWMSPLDMYVFPFKIKGLDLNAYGKSSSYSSPVYYISIKHPALFKILDHDKLVGYMEIEDLKVNIEPNVYIIKDTYDSYAIEIEEGDPNGKPGIYSECTGKIWKMRNWSIGRNRNWGIPIPAVKDSDTGQYILHKDGLRKINLDNKNYDLCNMVTDTFVDSAVYNIYYSLLNNENKPVDIYLGGSEFAVTHLLYARILTKMFKEIGIVNFEEPYKKFIPIGLILHEYYWDQTVGEYVFPSEVEARINNGHDVKSMGIEKMSKSLKNYVDFEVLNSEYGKALKLAILSDTPFEQSLIWKNSMVKAPQKFLKTLTNVDLSKHKGRAYMTEELELKDKLERCLEQFKLNVFISTLYTAIKRLKQEYSLAFLHYIEDIVYNCF